MKYGSGATAALLLTAGLAFSSVAGMASGNGPLAVSIDGLLPGGHLADNAAFCSPGHGDANAVRNVSPGISWSAGPEGTRSYALLMSDPDVPQDFSLINKEGTVIAAEASRISVFHWVLADIPASSRSLAQGAESQGLVPRGKPGGKMDHGVRGANVYTTFLASIPEMAGVYAGYDGPCPPVNDLRVHRYIVRIFALDVETLGLTGAFTGETLEKAMAGHVLATGQAEGRYTLNPALVSDRKD